MFCYCYYNENCPSQIIFGTFFWFRIDKCLGTDHLTCRGGVMVFCFVQKFFFGQHKSQNIYFFLSRKREFFFQYLTLDYMTKTLNQIIFFFPPPKSEYFFQQHWESEYFFRKKNITFQVKWSFPYSSLKFQDSSYLNRKYQDSYYSSRKYQDLCYLNRKYQDSCYLSRKYQDSCYLSRKYQDSCYLSRKYQDSCYLSSKYQDSCYWSRLIKRYRKLPVNISQHCRNVVYF